MSDKPWLRQLYDGVERRIAPPLEEFVRTDRYVGLTTAVGQVQGLVTGGIRTATTRLWHLVNLPAGTDVQSLRRQVGALDREVRRLTLQLSAQETPARPDVDQPPAPKVDDDANPTNPGTA